MEQQKRTLRQVGKQFHVSKETVRRGFLRFGLARKNENIGRGKYISLDIHQRIIEMHKQGYKNKEIAVHLGIGASTLYRWKRKARSDIWCGCGQRFDSIKKYKQHKKEFHQ